MDLERYDFESDVVVVGYGGAGAASAISAHDNGASVIILEKMLVAGGNTRVSGGSVLNPNPKEKEKVVQYLEAISYGTVEREVIEAFVENAIENRDWINQLGGETEPFMFFGVFCENHSAGASFPNVPGAESVAKIGVRGSEEFSAQRLWSFLSTKVEQRDIKVMMNTPAKELITNEKGEVVGVIAESEDKTISIRAKKAVILTCGGFEYDDKMKWDFLPCKPMLALGNPGNTGDGIKMAQKVGAAIWHMSAVSASIGFKSSEHEGAFAIRFTSEGYIFVDKNGSRFVNELGSEFHDKWRPLSIFDPGHLEYPYIPAYVIFDEVARRKGPLCPADIGINRDVYKWSVDNTAEIAKGWIIKGQTISDLARQISVDEAVLKNTVTRYNENCSAANDTDFGRPKETLRALDAPPYYALKFWPCLINTNGGPRRDKEARVLDPYGRPIPRLYAAGELGSIFGFLYQGSGNNGESLVFGRIAGRNAAKEKSL